MPSDGQQGQGSASARGCSRPQRGGSRGSCCRWLARLLICKLLSFKFRGPELFLSHAVLPEGGQRVPVYPGRSLTGTEGLRSRQRSPPGDLTSPPARLDAGVGCGAPRSAPGTGRACRRTPAPVPVLPPTGCCRQQGTCDRTGQEVVFSGFPRAPQGRWHCPRGPRGRTQAGPAATATHRRAQGGDVSRTRRPNPCSRKVPCGHFSKDPADLCARRLQRPGPAPGGSLRGGGADRCEPYSPELKGAHHLMETWMSPRIWAPRDGVSWATWATLAMEPVPLISPTACGRGPQARHWLRGCPPGWIHGPGALMVV